GDLTNRLRPRALSSNCEGTLRKGDRRTRHLRFESLAPSRNRRISRLPPRVVFHECEITKETSRRSAVRTPPRGLSSKSPSHDSRGRSHRRRSQAAKSRRTNFRIRSNRSRQPPSEIRRPRWLQT